ncbi:MAG TPA: peptidylprolyl isomerase [Tepidisphaeraceae bacterium]|nr:peptidylprolyl isomerase [Tepidisphaeraceae bacterium]
MSCTKIGMVFAMVFLGGCGLMGGGGSAKSRTLTSDSFYRSQPPSVSTTDDRLHAADRSGAIVQTPPAVDQPRVPAAQTVTTVAPVVKEVVAESPATLPGLPINTPSAASTGQYLTYGAVVVEVSGTPIYADKVLRLITPKLSEEARQRDFQSYTARARQEIDTQVSTMIKNELLYAAAVQNLAKEEKDLAESATMAWRMRQVTEAGGSLELARRKAAADGMDFDERATEQNRIYMVQLLFQKKLYPQVQVTAEEMRTYYDQHVKTEFTAFDEAQFRVIKITAARTGGREQAIEKIKDLHDKAVSMNDEAFAALAGSINDDPALMSSRGRVGGGDGWVQRGSFVVKDVEDAVWKIQPGQVSDVVEVNNSFYIARLENRKQGRMRSFDDEDVQAQIKDDLTKPQLAARQQQMEAKLLKSAVINPETPNTTPVLEMALQKYTEWRNKK